MLGGGVRVRRGVLYGRKSGRLLHHAWILFPLLGLLARFCGLLGWTAQSPDFPHSDSSSVSVDSAPSWGLGTGTPQCPSSFSFPSYVFSFWRQELPDRLLCFPLAWVPSRFSLLKLRSLFNAFLVEPWFDPLHRERPWDRRTYWWCRKRTSVNLSKYYPGLFVLCRH